MAASTKRAKTVDNYELNTVCLTKPTVTRRNTTVSYFCEGNPLSGVPCKFQLCPSGTRLIAAFEPSRFDKTGEGKLKLQVNITDPKIHAFCETLDDIVKDFMIANKSAFYKGNPSESMIRTLFRPIIKPVDEEKGYPPRIGIVLDTEPTSLNRVKVERYDPVTNQKFDAYFGDIKRGDEVIPFVTIDATWVMAGNRSGYNFKAVKLMYIPSAGAADVELDLGDDMPPPTHMSASSIAAPVPEGTFDEAADEAAQLAAAAGGEGGTVDIDPVTMMPIIVEPADTKEPEEPAPILAKNSKRKANDTDGAVSQKRR